MIIVDLESTLLDVGYIIEANTFEQHSLWEKYHEEVEWEDLCCGHGKTIGKIDNRPIFISLLYAKINEVLVLFWHLTSELADYKMAEEWLLENTNINNHIELHDAQNSGILQIGRGE